MDIAAQSQLFLARVAEAEGNIGDAESALKNARKYAEQAGHLGLIEEIEKEWLEITGEEFR